MRQWEVKVVVVQGEDEAKAMCAAFVDHSAWFEFTPLPDGYYEFNFKPEAFQWVDPLVRASMIRSSESHKEIGGE